MSTKSSSAAHATRSSIDCYVFGMLREIRATAQYLQKLFSDTKELASTLDPRAQAKLMDRALGDRMQARLNEPINRNLEELANLFNTDYVERDWCSDSIQTIDLKWSQVMDLWPDPTQSFDEQRRAIDEALLCLDEIVYECAALTISPRIKDTLKNLRVGQPLDWNFRFRSELPQSEALCKRLLQEMAQEVGVLKIGVVDVDQGLIYKVAKSRKLQSASAWRLALFVVIPGLIVPYVLAWIGWQTHQWPGDLSRFYATYALLFLGAGAHVAIDAVKTARARTRPNFQAINDWILWLHVRETSIFWSLAWVLLGYIVLTIATPTMSWQAAFFIGYSIDSILGLFLSRLEGVTKIKVQQLTGEKA